MITDTRRPRWLDVDPTGQTWEYGANPQPAHRAHLPMFLSPPVQRATAGPDDFARCDAGLDDDDRDFLYDCD